MKETVYKLETEIDGVKELVLRAPSRKQLKFASAVKSAFMSTAVEMAKNLGDRIDEPEGSDDAASIKGREMLMAMYAGSSVDVGDLIERFISTCTNSSMCQMNGGNVPDAFWDNVSTDDMEGLFAEFIENFITI